MLPRFFIDTADVEYIYHIWDIIGKYIKPYSLLGITTNPNALNKVGCNTLNDLEKLIPKLCKLTSEIIRKGPKVCGNSGARIYIQAPYSKMNPSELVKWAKYITDLSDNFTYTSIKIPHFNYSLSATDKLGQVVPDINVTGVSDWGTALKCFTYSGVKYVSLIPGRMEERGIDANAHLEALNDTPKQDGIIISGSMRTIEGLKNAIKLGTIPTIGTKVWEEIFKNPEEFVSYWQQADKIYTTLFTYAPLTTQANIDLSIEFFNQMDILGASMYKEFSNAKSI